jgi:geranylgeranyl reductase family protein
MKFDVAIIGAGPGGGMAACRLARTGMRIILLEKCRLPRSKACGGGLPAGIKAMFDWDITPFIDAEVSSVRYLYNYTREKIYRQSEPSIFMVERSRFDYALIERAVSLACGNINLRDGFHVLRVEESDHTVMIYGKNQEAVQADFVIAADGALSKTAKCLGLNQNAPCGLAMSADVEVVPEIFEVEKEQATFNFFCLPHGYGWIFPKNGYLSCGVGSWQGPRNSGLPKTMDDFLNKSFPSGSICSIKRLGHPIPAYAGQRDIATRRVCLVGDAASLVDPIMGEGIRFALQSGMLAADVIISLTRGEPVSGIHPEAVTWENGACRVYQKLIHDRLGQDLDILYRFALPIFQDAPEFFYRKFILPGYSYLEYFRNVAEKIAALKNHSAARAL